jgi:hypothetical protein
MKDKYNIEMEDISQFSLERSSNFIIWEDVTYKELEIQLLESKDSQQIKIFFGIVRTGSPLKLNGHFYRIK